MEEIKKEADRLIKLFAFESGYGICEDTGIKGITEEQAKQCVLICCDEIIETHKETYYNGFGQDRNTRTLNYWYQVKEYIEQNK